MREIVSRKIFKILHKMTEYAISRPINSAVTSFTYEDEESRATRFATKSTKESLRERKSRQRRRKKRIAESCILSLVHLSLDQERNREQPWTLRHGGLLPSVSYFLSLSPCLSFSPRIWTYKVLLNTILIFRLLWLRVSLTTSSASCKSRCTSSKVTQNRKCELRIPRGIVSNLYSHSNRYSIPIYVLHNSLQSRREREFNMIFLFL